MIRNHHNSNKLNKLSFKNTSRSKFSNRRSSAKQFHFNNYYFVYGLVAFLSLGIFLQMFRWQIVESDKYKTLASSQYIGEQYHDTRRGTIFASDGTILAIDEPMWGVYASLSQDKEERKLFFDNIETFIDQVAPILNMDKSVLRGKLDDDFVYAPLAHGVSNEKKQALSEIKICEKCIASFGLYYEKEEKRVYPNQNLASHILGFIGKDENGEDIGLYGVEGYYFSDLTGKKGKTYEEKDSQGNIILTAEYDPILPREGKDIYLTINPVIQSKVEKALKEGVQKNQAKSGTAIIMDPKTGAIIAMANYPDFNPNEYWQASSSWIYKNKAVADVYEYGSVQKPITEAVAYESGNVPDDFICHDDTGFMELYDKKIYTWDKQPDGDLNMAQILQYSNNPCIATVALEIGHEYYYPKLQEFGIGKFIGVGLQDESTSYLMPYESWTKLDLAVTSFGQSISATPLQIISALSTIANDGKRMKPYLVTKISDNEETIEYQPQVLATPISIESARKVAANMETVVRQGESRTFFNKELSEYSIAGKTGTAQIPKPNEPGYYDDRTNATFIGFSPVEDSKMIMLVRIEEPKIDTFSASTAVPVWISIFKAVADDLGIEKNK